MRAVAKGPGDTPKIVSRPRLAAESFKVQASNGRNSRIQKCERARDKRQLHLRTAGARDSRRSHLVHVWLPELPALAALAVLTLPRVRQASVCLQHLIVGRFSSCCSCRAFVWGASESCCRHRVRLCVTRAARISWPAHIAAACRRRWANFAADWLRACLRFRDPPWSCLQVNSNHYTCEC